MATAVVTSAMLRTWPVRLSAMELTLSVRSFQVPATPGTSAWPPSLPSVPTSRATRVTSEANAVELVDHGVDGVLQLQDLALDVDGDLAARGRRWRPRSSTSAMLRTWPVRLPAIEFTLSVRSFQVPATPGTCGLAAELALGADLARDARHLGGEAVELVDHRVDGVLQLQDLALDVDRDLARQVAVGDRRRHLGDVAHLAGQVGGHQVHVVGEVLPGAGDAGHLGLAAELALGADLARHAA